MSVKSRRWKIDILDNVGPVYECTIFEEYISQWSREEHIVEQTDGFDKIAG